MVDSDIKAALEALRLQVEGQVKLADRIGEPHLAAIFCEAEACIDKLLKR